MPEDVLNPEYWAERLREAKDPHHAVFKCGLDRWQRIEAKHREILARTIRFADSVLDVGCGYGRLLDLMPRNWGGIYLGAELSTEMILKAKELHPTYWYLGGDIRKSLPVWVNPDSFDWAVLISFRPMIRRNCGNEVWAEMEAAVRKVARKLLYLEYDETDEGSVE